MWKAGGVASKVTLQQGVTFFCGEHGKCEKTRHIESHIFRILTNAVEWWDDTAVKIGIEIKNLTIEMEIIN